MGVFIHFYRLADLHRRAVEQDGGIGLAVFKNIGPIPRSGSIKDGCRRTRRLRHDRIAGIDPLFTIPRLRLHRCCGCGGLRHKQVISKLCIHDSAGSHGLLLEHDNRGLLGIINHIELRRVTATRPDRVFPGLRSILKSTPGIPDPQRRDGASFTNSIRDQAQIGGVHRCFAVRIDIANGKSIVRESGHKAQRSSQLTRHAVFAKKRNCICRCALSCCHIRQHAVSFHALVADIQRPFLVIDEEQFFALAKDSERRFVLVLHEYLFILIFDCRYRVAFGNVIQVARNSNKSKLVVSRNRGYMACRGQFCLCGGHNDVCYSPPVFAGHICQNSIGGIHSMNGNGVRFAPIGVQIQRTRDRLRKIILCINIGTLCRS